MNQWKKLLLPLGLGAAAAVVNWIAVSSKVAPEAFVRLNKDVKRGEVFAAADLERIELSGDLGSLPETAVRWMDRATVYQRPAPRSLKKGDLVLWRDATPLPRELPAGPNEVLLGVSLSGLTSVPDFIQVGQQVGFFVGRRTVGYPVRPSAASTAVESRPQAKYLGPFRVLAVGKRITPGGELRPEASSSTETILTVAAKFLPNTRELDEQSARLLAARTDFGEERILGIVLHVEREDAALARN